MRSSASGSQRVAEVAGASARTVAAGRARGQGSRTARRLERAVQRRWPMTLSGNTIRTAPAERLRVDAVLLDLDGTLVASNDAHARAWVEVLREHGFAPSFDEVRALIGMGGEQLVEKLTGYPPVDERNARLREEHGRVFRERYVPELERQPCAREMVVKLRERGFKLVVATSSSEEDVGPLIEVAGIGDLIDGHTNADDVAVAKPAPDVVHAALEKARVNPDHAILIGDTPYDVAAGRVAGVAVIALRCGGWDDAALDGAIEVFDDPEDLLRNWMQTPFRKSLSDLDAPL